MGQFLPESRAVSSFYRLGECGFCRVWFLPSAVITVCKSLTGAVQRRRRPQPARLDADGDPGRRRRLRGTPGRRRGRERSGEGEGEELHAEDRGNGRHVEQRRGLKHWPYSVTGAGTRAEALALLCYWSRDEG